MASLSPNVDMPTSACSRGCALDFCSPQQLPVAAYIKVALNNKLPTQTLIVRVLVVGTEKSRR